jgi:hypothetical protein
MPRVLQLEATTTGGGGVVCELLCASTVLITAGMAVEIIEQIDAGTPQAVGDHRDYAIMVQVPGDTGWSTVTPLDQNKFAALGQTAAPRATDIYRWVTGRWYARVMSLDAYIGQNVRGVQLLAKGGQAGTYRHRFARVSVTQYRRPIYWFYKDGMPIPDVSTTAAIAPASVARLCLLDVHEHYPLLCTTLESPDTMLDSVRVDRASSGTVRRWVEWAGRKTEFTLEHIVVELERQGLEAFYDVYRGGDDWFFWQHRANYPDQRVVFLEVPKIVPVSLRGGDMRYRASVRLGEV